MDFLINIFIGLGIGTALAGWNRSRPAQQVKLMIMGAVGAVFPNLDSITLHTYFDSTFGKWFGLEESGVEIYFGTHWYSHQAFMHSLFAAVFFAFLLSMTMALIYKYPMRSAPSFQSALKYVSIYGVTFFLAYFMHLLADMTAPAGAWEGIRFFFPMEVYIGGWGMTWWWNNYDLTLVLIFVVILNLALIAWIPPLRKGMRYLPLCVCGFAFMLISWQLSSRGYDFNNAGYASREKASHLIQRQILGEDLHTFMAELDSKLPFYY